MPINQQRSQYPLASRLPSLLEHPQSLLLAARPAHDLVDAVLAHELENGRQLRRRGRRRGFDDVELEARHVGAGANEGEDLLGGGGGWGVEEREDVDGVVLCWPLAVGRRVQGGKGMVQSGTW